MVRVRTGGADMTSTDVRKTIKAILAALRMRLYLSLGFGYSTLFPRRDALLIRADKTARRRAMFIQRLPARIVILTTVGMFFFFLVVENEVGLITVLFLLPSFIIPIAVLLGAFLTTRVDSIEVCLRREYARLSADFVDDLPCSGLATPRESIEDRLCDYRTNRYRETRKILRRTRRLRTVR
jgi:hypothetical protein